MGLLVWWSLNSPFLYRAVVINSSVFHCSSLACCIWTLHYKKKCKRLFEQNMELQNWFLVFGWLDFLFVSFVSNFIFVRGETTCWSVFMHKLCDKVIWDRFWVSPSPLKWFKSLLVVNKKIAFSYLLLKEVLMICVPKSESLNWRWPCHGFLLKEYLIIKFCVT